MDGKVVLITGANTGIGKATAEAVAARGARTILACRDLAKADLAAQEIRASTGNDDVTNVRVDLADLEDVERCAVEVLDRFGRLDVLVNNAGGTWSVPVITPQGFEQTFVVNYLSHYLLTRLLLGSLLRAAPSRIVNVTSVGHRFVRGMDWDDLQYERRWSPRDAYGQSKLAQILFTRELARRFGGDGVVAHAAHPGFVRTRFGADGDTYGGAATLLRVGKLVSVSPAHGAKTSIHLATSPQAALSNGGYWARAKPGHPSRAAKDDASARRLWDVSERLITGVGIRVPPSRG
jgi:retinol dehydrogenase-12